MTWYDDERKKVEEETAFKLRKIELENKFRPMIEQMQNTDEFESLIRNMNTQDQNILRGLRAEVDHQRDLDLAFEKGFTSANEGNAYNSGWNKKE